MLTIKQACSQLALDEEWVRSALREAAASADDTLPGSTGQRLSPAALRALLARAGKGFRSTRATIGMEKGGVGKSFLTVNTAVALAMRGSRVLVIDLDPEACASNFLLPDETDYSALGTMLEVYTSETLGFADVVVPSRYEGLDIVACKPKARRVSRVLTRHNPKRLLRERLGGTEEYDIILFEVPPTFGDVVASAYLTSDMVVLPVVPDIWSIESLELTLEDIREECESFECALPAFRILVNRYARSRTASRDACETLETDFGEMLLPHRVPESAPVQNAINEGKSIYEQRCPKPVRQAVDALATLICPVVPLGSSTSAPDHGDRSCAVRGG